MKKKLFAIVLSLALLISAIPATSGIAMAAEQQAASIDWAGGIDTSLLTNAEYAGAAELIQILQKNCKYLLNDWWQKMGFSNWQEAADLTMPESGKAPEYRIRPLGHACYTLAVALRFNVYDAATAGYDKDTALAMLEKLIGSAARAHISNGGNVWGAGGSANNFYWQSAMWAESIGYAAWLFWDELSEKTHTAVTNMVIAEANDKSVNYTVPYYRNTAGTIVYKNDTKSEENAWNSRILALALNMFPQNANADLWQYKLYELLISATAVPNDVKSSETVDGIAVKDVLQGSNAETEYTVINHGMPHIDYMCATFEAMIENVTAGALVGKPGLQASLFNLDKIYDALVNLDLGMYNGQSFTVNGTTTTVKDMDGKHFYVRNAEGNATYEYTGPVRNDWGSARAANYYYADVVADLFNLDAGFAEKVTADKWGSVRLARLTEMVGRGSSGQIYYRAADGYTTEGSGEKVVAFTDVENFHARDTYAMSSLAQIYLLEKLNANNMIRIANDSDDLGILTDLKEAKNAAAQSLAALKNQKNESGEYVVTSDNYEKMLNLLYQADTVCDNYVTNYKTYGAKASNLDDYAELAAAKQALQNVNPQVMEFLGNSVTVNIGTNENIDSTRLCELAEAEVERTLIENGYTGYEATISYTTDLTTESGADYAASYSKAGFKLEIQKGSILQKTVYPFEIKVKRENSFNAVLGEPNGFAGIDVDSLNKLEITGNTVWEVVDGNLVHTDVKSGTTSFFVMDVPKGDKHFSMEAEYTQYSANGTSEISLLLGNSKEKNALQIAFTIPSTSKKTNPYYCVQVLERPYTSATDWGNTHPNLFFSGNLGEEPYNLLLNDVNKKLKIDVYMQGSVLTYQVNGITITQFDLAAYDDAFKDDATAGIPKDINALLQSVDTFGYGCVRNMDLTIKNVSLECYQTRFGDEERRTESKSVIKNGETMDAAFAGIFYGFGVDSIETEEGMLLNEGTDYSVEENVIKLKKEYLNQLTEDTRLKVNFAAGQPGYISLTLTEAGVMMPSAVFNARSMTLSNVDAGMFYQLSENGEWIAITAESVSLADNSVDPNYGIRVKNVVDGQESEIQTITVSKHKQPSVASTNVDAITISDYNTLLGYEYEISSDNGGTWRTVSVDSTGKTEYLDAGTYQIRVKGVSTILNSDSAEVTISHVHGNITHKDAKTASCTEGGNNEYWTCGICHKVYMDEACESETTMEDVTLPALEHKMTKVNETPATCTVDGNIAYWTCSVCKKNFTDDKGENEITDLAAWKAGDGKIAAAHNWASGWSKDETGHWYACANCDAKKDFAAHNPGAEATETTAQTCTVCDYIITPATGHIDHSHRTLVKGQAATCTADGWKDYYKCNGCDKLFDAETAGNEITDLATWKVGDGKIAAAHDWASEWSKDENGHWYACANCDAKKDFAAHNPGAEATETTAQTCTVCDYIITPATGHIDHSHRTLVKGQAATCTADGWKDYYKCNGCDKLFDAETAGNEITDLATWKAGDGKIAAAHELKKTDEVPATTTQYGVKAYWTCSVCQKNFSDAEGKTEIADLEAWKQNEGRIDKKSSGGGSYRPIQKPVIEKNDNVKTELSSDGTKLTIKAEDGYEITDVLVNGVSKGVAGELTGLKTGDKVEIKTAKKAEPIQPTDPSTDKNAKLVKGIENTSIILKSKLTENRKVLLTWTKSKGYKVDSYEVYRSVKKNSGYGKTAFFKTKDGNWSKYLNTKGLKAGKTYYYKVRGVRTIDGQKYYTQWSNKAWRTI